MFNANRRNLDRWLVGFLLTVVLAGTVALSGIPGIMPSVPSLVAPQEPRGWTVTCASIEAQPPPCMSVVESTPTPSSVTTAPPVSPSRPSIVDTSFCTQPEITAIKLFVQRCMNILRTETGTLGCRDDMMNSVIQYAWAAYPIRTPMWDTLYSACHILRQIPAILSGTPITILAPPPAPSADSSGI